MNTLSIKIKTNGLTPKQAQALASFSESLTEGVNESLPLKFAKVTPATDTLENVPETEKVLSPAQKAAATKAAKSAQAELEKQTTAEAIEVKDPEPVKPEINSEDWPEPDAPETETTSDITLMDLRSLLKVKVATHKDTLVKELTRYKASGVSDLDKKHYLAFYTFMQALA